MIIRKDLFQYSGLEEYSRRLYISPDQWKLFRPIISQVGAGLIGETRGKIFLLLKNPEIALLISKKEIEEYFGVKLPYLPYAVNLDNFGKEIHVLEPLNSDTRTTGSVPKFEIDGVVEDIPTFPIENLVRKVIFNSSFYEEKSLYAIIPDLNEYYRVLFFSSVAILTSARLPRRTIRKSFSLTHVAKLGKLRRFLVDFLSYIHERTTIKVAIASKGLESRKKSAKGRIIFFWESGLIILPAKIENRAVAEVSSSKV